ncbi:MAG: hypothetical protein JWL69_2294, partial [Phycisphaerales bacterium]|nr:hypothetical protein [Phycisphaerales bacterium]
MLLSGVLPVDVNASADAVYVIAGDATSGYAVTFSAGVIAFGSNVGAAGGDWPNLSLTVTGSAVLAVNSPETLSALTLAGSAKVVVTSSGGGISGNLLDITGTSGFSMPLTGTAPTATLDMMDNDMILRGEGDAELPVLRTLLKSGRNGPGLKSSDATESGTSFATKLGYGDGFGAFDGSSSIDGQAVSPTDVLVKYTLNGDMNLDGSVHNNDFALFSNHFGSNAPPAGTAVWTTGDFDY